MIADDVADKLRGNAMFQSVESVKPGFLNLKLDGDFLAGYLREMQKNQRFGAEKQSIPRRS